MHQPHSCAIMVLIQWKGFVMKAVTNIEHGKYALYDEARTVRHLIFKTGGVDGCDCAEILRLIEAGKIGTTPLIPPAAISWRISQRLTSFLKTNGMGLFRLQSYCAARRTIP